MLSKTTFSKYAKEPPFRLVFKALYRRLPVSVETRALWDISPAPPYLTGVWLAARQAVKESAPEISVFEFGVAGGNGLLDLEQEARAVSKATGIRIKVFGFDNGAQGLPPLSGDYRDHPDAWVPGDFPMDEQKLRARLAPETELVLGDIQNTVPPFVAKGKYPPIGFISIDVDLYSSTVSALKILSLPGSAMLNRVFLYFDDIEAPFCHRFAGELLAIDEFNDANETIKIDRLRGFKGRPFPEAPYLKQMYAAHNLQAISGLEARRPVNLRLTELKTG